VEIFLTIIILILVAALMAAGIIGIFVPFMPDVVFILLGALVFGLFDKFQHISGWTYLILIVLALAVTLIDYFATIVGAKKLGATKFGIIGGIVGTLIGLVGGSIIGMILGSVIGTILGELLSGRKLLASLKSGSGAVIGILGGSLVKLIISFVMIIVFILAVFF